MRRCVIGCRIPWRGCAGRHSNSRLTAREYPKSNTVSMCSHGKCLRRRHTYRATIRVVYGALFPHRHRKSARRGAVSPAQPASERRIGIPARERENPTVDRHHRR